MRLVQLRDSPWRRSRPTRVCSLLFCCLRSLPHGLAGAERQKITDIQCGPTNQRETPCLSFSTLCLYLDFPSSEELGSQHLLLPRINRLAGCCGKEICIQSGAHGRHPKRGLCSCPQTQTAFCFKRPGVYKTKWTRTELLIAHLNRI